MPKRALVSVSDKAGLIELARGLADLGWKLVASGGTGRALRDAGIDVQDVKELTGFPEALGGRVKTLHPVIHAGILAQSTERDMRELKERGIDPIDLVVVNLYPFEDTVARSGVSIEEATEEIDIGGVALLRAAAKNFARVGVVSHPSDYPAILSELREQGALGEETRRRLALKAFRHTAGYDAAISRFLAERGFSPGEERFSEQIILGARRLELLRYGENPHQEAALYGTGAAQGALGGRLLQGKPLSYNNILDLDSAWRIVASFEEPTVAIIKHTNPCGVASGDDLAEAFPVALAGDPVSAFGSVISVNRSFDEGVARAMGELFVEAIVAPGFSHQAVEYLAQHKRNCRLVDMCEALEDTLLWEVRSVRCGLLLQERDECQDDPSAWEIVSRRLPNEGELAALEFGWKVVSHVRSNAIVFCGPGAAYGVGAGQMSRVDAVRLAAMKAGEKSQGAVMASDAFFPFPDGIEEAARAGVTAMVQPGGSVRDAQVIDAANRLDLAMIFTGRRHFRH
jgi:phosphoribosylaminoimidazolecarboxamide formyltransferase/IMP cyclohydrolase